MQVMTIEEDVEENDIDEDDNTQKINYNCTRELVTIMRVTP